MANIVVPTITENGSTTLATTGKLCTEHVDIVGNVEGVGGVPPVALTITGDGCYRSA